MGYNEGKENVHILLLAQQAVLFNQSVIQSASVVPVTVHDEQKT